MKNYSLLLVCIFMALILPGGASAQSTSLSSTFTYQGYLTGAGGAVSGACDFQFALYDALTNGTQIGNTLTKTNIVVANGTFSVQLDFGVEAFDGTDRYMQVWVRCPAGSGSYTTLSPRQTVTAAPYALALYGMQIQFDSVSPNVIGGYSGNSVSPSRHGATIGGGGAASQVNQVTNDYGTVSGGAGNLASGYMATVGGGQYNTANAQYSTVVGGDLNTASGFFSTVLGGIGNKAASLQSVASGYYAAANHSGTFVWSDYTFLPNGFYSTAPNQFAIHASGGIRMVTGSDAQGLDQVYCYMYVGQGSWSCSSDRNAKQDFAEIDSQAVLASVVNMPITSWAFKGTTTRHIGPMAQDFYAAFGVGENDKTITNVDADGVALAAIQGLNQIVGDQHDEIEALKAENSELKTRLDDIESRLGAVESAANPINESSLAIPMLIFSAVMFVWRRKG